MTMAAISSKCVLGMHYYSSRIAADPSLFNPPDTPNQFYNAQG